MLTNIAFKKLFCLLLIVILLVGCSPSAPIAVDQPPAGAELPAETAGAPAGKPVEETGSAPQPVSPPEEDEVAIVPGLAAPAAPRFEPLGSASFRVDTDASVTAEYTAMGEAVELALTDANGLTWTLSVPAGALDGPLTLTMTPLSGVQSADVDGLAGGVLLEPDGLVFHGTARLSVSGAELGEGALLYGAAHDGSGVDFAMQDDSGTAALIDHFSSYFASPKSTSAQDKAVSQYQQAASEGKVILKQPITVAEPPNTPLECTDEKTSKANEKAIEEWAKSASSPELEIILRLLKARTSLASMTFATGEWSGVGEMEIRLIERLGKKVYKLQKAYNGRPEKLNAVATFTLRVVRQIQLLGGSDETSSSLLEGLSAWFLKAVDQMLTDAEQKHDYKKAFQVLTLLRNSGLTGNVGYQKVDAVLKRFESALTFEVVVRFKAALPDEKWETESTASPVQAKIAHMGYWSGAGKGKYLSATSPSADVTTRGFATQVTVTGFDPCKGTVNIGIDRFGASAETYTLRDTDLPPYDMPLVQNTGMSLYEQYKTQDANLATEMYVFPMALRNNDPTAAQQTFENAKFGKVSGVLEIKLIHKP